MAEYKELPRTIPVRNTNHEKIWLEPMKLQDSITAIAIFEESAMRHALATEDGDYKEANKNYNKIIRTVSFLRKQNSLELLYGLLSNSNVGVRLWSATYLLTIYESEAVAALDNISKNENAIHSLSAATTLSEWKSGNLHLYS